MQKHKIIIYEKKIIIKYLISKTKIQVSGIASPGITKALTIVAKGFRSRLPNTRRFSSFKDSGKIKKPKTTLSAENTAAIQKGAVMCQPDAIPPSAGPKTNPTPKAAPIMPKAAPRSSGFAMSEM